MVKSILMILIIIIMLFVIVLFVVEKLIFTPFKGTAKNWPHHSDLEGRHVVFRSRKAMLNGWFYGENNDAPKGLIIFSHGMGVTSEYYLPEIIYYVNAGYKVFAFDDTGYGMNKGQFWGIPQAVIDLKNAIDYADDGTLPVTLMGHSMGGYAVCCVLKYLDFPKHNIRNVVTYAAFDNLPETLASFLKAQGNFPKMIAVKIICFGQFLLFGSKFYVKVTELVEKNKQVQFIIIHGDEDEEIDMNTVGLISKVDTYVNVHKMIISEPGINTHMGVVRKNGIAANGINGEICKRIVEKL